jgi:hypothetical protein
MSNTAKLGAWIVWDSEIGDAYTKIFQTEEEARAYAYKQSMRDCMFLEFGQDWRIARGYADKVWREKAGR